MSEDELREKMEECISDCYVKPYQEVVANILTLIREAGWKSPEEVTWLNDIRIEKTIELCKETVISLCNTVESKDETIIALTKTIQLITTDPQIKKFVTIVQNMSEESIKDMEKLKGTVK